MRWRRSTGVLWRVAPGYLVLGTPEGRLIEVDGPGGDLWQLLASWIDQEELTTVLAGRYGADEEVVKGDVQSLLNELSAQGYVECAG